MTGYSVTRLSAGDSSRLQELMQLFSDVFEEPETYSKAPPDAAYLSDLLSQPDFIALVARSGGTLLGGLTAYVLRKPEQKRSEIYVYDLAVSKSHRRSGVATALLREVQALASDIGAWTVFIQSELDDAAPTALYSRLGSREAVYHFDLPPRAR